MTEKALPLSPLDHSARCYIIYTVPGDCEELRAVVHNYLTARTQFNMKTFRERQTTRFKPLLEKIVVRGADAKSGYVVKEFACYSSQYSSRRTKQMPSDGWDINVATKLCEFPEPLK